MFAAGLTNDCGHLPRSGFSVHASNHRIRQWRSRSKILGGAKYFDFERGTVFGLRHRLSKHQNDKIRKKFCGKCPLWAPLATPTAYATFVHQTWATISRLKKLAWRQSQKRAESVCSAIRRAGMWRACPIKAQTALVFHEQTHRLFSSHSEFGNGTLETYNAICFSPWNKTQSCFHKRLLFLVI